MRTTRCRAFPSTCRTSACACPPVANPLDKFQLGVRKLIEDLMIQRMAENDKIVTRYMDDGDFQRTAFPILAKEIFEAVHAQQNPAGGSAL